MVDIAPESQYDNKDSGGGEVGTKFPYASKGTAPNPWSRLKSAVITSRRQLEGFRAKRLEFIRQYVGKQYTFEGAHDKVPANMIEQFVSIYRRELVSQNPQIMVTATVNAYKRSALDMESEVNEDLREMNYEEDLENTVVDALFSVGIQKVGNAEVGQVLMDGDHIPYGEPFIDTCDLDDMVIDMNARHLKECGFIGDRVRVPMEELKQSGRFAGHEEKMVSVNRRYYSETGEELVEHIDTGTDYDRYEDVEYTEYWELYRPRENDIIVYLCDDQGLPTGEPVEVRDWFGPPNPTGPYHFLAFNPVPNNPLPVSPVAIVFDLHEAANRIYRKVMRQAERQKTNTLVRVGKSGDGQALLDADDGDMIPADDPKNTQEVASGGFDQNNMAFFVHAKQLFSQYSGNLEAVGGLGQTAETLGQSEMIQQTSSLRLDDMRAQTEKYVGCVARCYAWYLFNDPLYEREITRSVAGTNITFKTLVTPESRQGGFPDYKIRVEPYSMASRTPLGKLQDMLRAYQQVILPTMPMLSELGVGFKFDRFIEVLAKLWDLPELMEVMMLAPSPGDVPPVAGKGSRDRPTASPVSSRTYNHVSQPGATQRGQEDVLLSNLLGSRMQEGQEAGFMRTTG